MQARPWVRRLRSLVVPVIIASAAALGARGAQAQDCQPCQPSPSPPPPPAWKVSLGGGLSRTGGNTETSSYNVSVEAAYDPHGKNVVRGSGMYLRASDGGVTTASRSLAAARDEYTVNGRAFVYGQIEYQRDVFKGVEHVVSPQGGVGVKVVDGPKIVFALDGGLGAAFEKLLDEASTTKLAVNSSDRVEWKPSPTLNLFQKASALWKADDFGDAYYHAELGLTTRLAKRLDLKLAFTDDYKTRPPTPALKKNDTSFVASLLFKL
jgi:putative salt-induced outer membrane protein YdiY